MQTGRIDTDMYHCPFCGKAIELLQFGYGWIGKCCNQIVYNNPKPYAALHKETLEKDSALG